jgi:quercetin dioxygenase-like cupin family protein
MSSTSTPLPNPRLVVTAHDSSGHSVFASDAEIDLFRPFGPQGSGFGRFHSRLSVPVSNTTSPPEMPNAIIRCPPNGVAFGTTDIAPNFTVPMHRTISLDYAVVISGQIVLKLDGGDERTVVAGESIVQRGTNHQWINRTDQVCRMAFVMVAAEKVVLENGTVLEEIVPKPPQK